MVEGAATKDSRRARDMNGRGGQGRSERGGRRGGGEGREEEGDKDDSGIERRALRTGLLSCSRQCAHIRSVAMRRAFDDIAARRPRAGIPAMMPGLGVPDADSSPTARRSSQPTRLLLHHRRIHPSAIAASIALRQPPSASADTSPCATPTPPHPQPSPTTMSAPAPSDVNTKKAVDDAPNEPKDQQKPAAALEEDDEFEDFPVEGKRRHIPPAATPAARIRPPTTTRRTRTHSTRAASPCPTRGPAPSSRDRCPFHTPPTVTPCLARPRRRLGLAEAEASQRTPANAQRRRLGAGRHRAAGLEHAPVGGELGRRRHERRLLGAVESRAGEGWRAEEELNVERA